MTIETTVIINDLQMPFQDQPVLDLVLSFIKELVPNRIILNGDVVDCYGISEFSKNPLTPRAITEEIQLAGKLMATLQDIEEKVWIGGNHEDRLRRMVWNRAPALDGIEAVEFPNLFRLSEYAFQWLPYGDYYRLGKLVVTHGDMVRAGSGTTAKAHFERYGTNVLIGHTHRMGAFYRTRLGKPHVAYENGCLCKLKVEYVNNPDWQQGFAVVHVDKPSGMFNVQQIPIMRYSGVVRFYYGNECYRKKEGK